MRKPILPAAVMAAALLVSTGATAQISELKQINVGSTAVAVKDPVDIPDPCHLTQNVDPNTLVDGTSVACADPAGVTTENSWYRLFDLDVDHGATSMFEIESIDWGSQSVIGPVTVTINAYCLDDGLPFLLQFLIPAGSTGPIALTDENLVFHSNAVTNTNYCEAWTQSLVVEIRAEDCDVTGCTHFFVGMNDLGQSAPTYIASGSCGIDDPVDLATMGFPNAHLVMVVHGLGGCPPDDDGGGGGDVPATTGVGALLLLLILLGSGAYFLRGRAAT
jgi:hypothetical protein